MKARIRHEGKARWVYTCDPCHHRYRSVDQFGAIENQQHHERSTVHLAAEVGETFKAVAEAFKTVIEAATQMFDHILTALTPLTEQLDLENPWTSRSASPKATTAQTFPGKSRSTTDRLDSWSPTTHHTNKR